MLTKCLGRENLEPFLRSRQKVLRTPELENRTDYVRNTALLRQFRNSRPSCVLLRSYDSGTAQTYKVVRE